MSLMRQDRAPISVSILLWLLAFFARMRSFCFGLTASRAFFAGMASLSAQLAGNAEAISETSAKITEAEAIGDRELHLLYLAKMVELRKEKNLLTEQQQLPGEYEQGYD